jgi:predicted transcriptional regulator
MPFGSIKRSQIMAIHPQQVESVLSGIAKILLNRLYSEGNGCMAITITLSPELETLLLDRAAQQGQEVNLVASELLAGVLEWQEQDSAEAIKGIQQGLDDFEVGRFRDFQEFADEQRLKYNLPTDS